VRLGFPTCVLLTLVRTVTGRSHKARSKKWFALFGEIERKNKERDPKSGSHFLEKSSGKIKSEIQKVVRTFWRNRAEKQNSSSSLRRLPWLRLPATLVLHMSFGAQNLH
jgi:hypothetical protein